MDPEHEEKIEEEEEYLSDGRKKGKRTIQYIFPLEKSFKVENIDVNIFVTLTACY